MNAIGERLFERLSSCRSEIMAFAILVIMVFHTYCPYNLGVFQIIKDHGDIGVDLFFFVSGFSMSHSLNKDSSIRNFYLKRVIRILVPCLLILFPFYFAIDLVHHASLKEFLLDISFLNFFVNYRLDAWFIPAIIVFYLITPLYRSGLRNYPVIEYLPWALVFILFVLEVSGVKVYPGIMVNRLPIFLLGVNVFEKQRIIPIQSNAMSSIVLVFCLLVSLLVYLFVIPEVGEFPLRYLLYFLITPFLSFINIGCSALGGITLELYLIHERVQKYMKILMPNYYLMIGCTLILTFLLAIVAHYFVQKIALSLSKRIKVQ